MTQPPDDPVEWRPRDEPLYGGPAAPVPQSPPAAYYGPVSPPTQYLPVPPPMVVIAQAPPTSGAATASMVLGIIGLVGGCCTFGVPSLIAVILGHVGLRETRGNVKSGHGMAVAGLVLGYIVFAPAVAFSVWFLIAGGIGAVTGVDATPTPTP